MGFLVAQEAGSGLKVEVRVWELQPQQANPGSLVWLEPEVWRKKTGSGTKPR